LTFKRSFIFWISVLLILVGYLLYQTKYISHHPSPNDFVNPLNEKEVIFVSVKDHNLSFRNKGFDPLTDSLRFWELNEKDNTVFLKEPSLLPTEFTPLVVVYDRGNGSFEKQENVLPISTFPYAIYQNNVELDILDIGKDGTLFFRFDDKQLSIETGETYQTFFFDGFKLRNISIENFGIKRVSQFKLFPEVEKELRREKAKLKK
jgi:hypothetical protein